MKIDEIVNGYRKPKRFIVRKVNPEDNYCPDDAGKMAAMRHAEFLIYNIIPEAYVK